MTIMAISCSHPDTVPFHLEGTAEGAGDQYATLKLYGTSMFDEEIRIDIVDGKIDTVLSLDPNTVYCLLIPTLEGGGAWMGKSLLACGKGASVKSKYVSSTDAAFMEVKYDFKEGRRYNRIMGTIDSTFKERFDRLRARQDSLVMAGSMLTEYFKELCMKSNNMALTQEERDAADAEIYRLHLSGEELTEEGYAVEQDYKACMAERAERMLSDVKSHKPSLATFLLLAEAIERAKDPGDCIALYNERFANLFPDCNLHDAISKKIASTTVYTGSKYKDFCLPDTEGDKRTLSSLIEGKVAVVEFWASWCGSCRARCRAMIPVYEKFKDKGFTFVGVAREYGDDAQCRAAVDRDGYSWVNLIALEEHHNIFAEYGYPDSVGASFLIGRDGTILKINPTLEDIEEAMNDNK